MTVIVQLSLDAKSFAGSREKLVGPPLAVAACAPDVAHEIEYHESVTLTGSLKVIVTFASRATPVAPLDGEVDATDGPVSLHDARLRGVFGLTTWKSALLLSVS